MTSTTPALRRRPHVRRDAIARFPQLLDALSDLANKISAEEMRHLNSEVDANQRDPPP